MQMIESYSINYLGRENLLVYFHGFGGDMAENLDFQHVLASHLDANLLEIQAGLPSKRPRGGFAWYPISKDRRHYLKDNSLAFQMGQSLGIIGNEISLKGLEYSDVILSGRSQGALVALRIGEHIPESKAVIMLAPFYKTAGFGGNYVPKVPVIWCEAEKDEVLPEKQKNSHKELSARGADVRTMMMKGATHDYLNPMEALKISKLLER